MIQNYDVLQIGFYEYGQCFTGSDTGMRYRIAREPLENVHFTPMDKRGGTFKSYNLARALCLRQDSRGIEGR